MFTRPAVIVLTNKQTDRQMPLKTPNALRYATTLANNYNYIITVHATASWVGLTSSVALTNITAASDCTYARCNV